MTEPAACEKYGIIICADAYMRLPVCALLLFCQRAHVQRVVVVHAEAQHVLL